MCKHVSGLQITLLAYCLIKAVNSQIYGKLQGGHYSNTQTTTMLLQA